VLIVIDDTDSRKEKELRAKVKSEAQRLLSKNNVVIVDALNYIKGTLQKDFLCLNFQLPQFTTIILVWGFLLLIVGYRYEIFCMSKAVPTRQVTVQCDVSQEQAWLWNESRPENEQYNRSVILILCLYYVFDCLLKSN